MPINIHILNSTGKLDDHVNEIQQEIHRHIPKICEFLDLKNVDICINHDPTASSPTTGLGGTSFNPSTLMLSVNVDHPDLRKNITTLMGELLSHEMHHCARMEHMDEAKNLRDYLVTEGLACLFESEFNGGNVSSLFSEVQHTDWKELYNAALSHFEDEDFSFKYWFFNTSSDKIPKYAGYWLGYNMAKTFMEESGIGHYDMLNIPSKQFELE